VTRNLRRRIERLEKGISRGDFETKVRALAERCPGAMWCELAD
jgi:hypothetical protein